MELVADANFDNVRLLAHLITLGNFPAHPADQVDRWWSQLCGLPFTFPSPTVGESTFVPLKWSFDTFQQYEHHNAQQVTFLQSLNAISPNANMEEVALKLLREM